MAKSFSFDIVSDFDTSEMNNAVDQARREIANRYDFKGTAARVEFRDNDKTGLTITGENQYQLDAIMDMVRKKGATRGLNQKVFDTSNEPIESNLKLTWDVPFIKGLGQDKVKRVSKTIHDAFPRVKTQTQGDELRVMSTKKDELQAIMQLLKKTDFDFPLEFTNYR